MDLENRNELPNSLEEHWMPFTSNHDFKDSPRLMVKAEGMYYTDHHGNQLIDASSGLFCSPAGHGRQEIREAVYKQLEQLDVYLFYLSCSKVVQCFFLARWPKKNKGKQSNT